jgi:hypothetical protein
MSCPKCILGPTRHGLLFSDCDAVGFVSPSIRFSSTSVLSMSLAPSMPFSSTSVIFVNLLCWKESCLLRKIYKTPLPRCHQDIPIPPLGTSPRDNQGCLHLILRNVHSSLKTVQTKFIQMRFRFLNWPLPLQQHPERHGGPTSGHVRI